MAKYELCIAVVDEVDIHPTIKRKNQGDIICIRPYPWPWGRKEIDEYIIVLVESKMTFEEITKFGEGIYRDVKNDKLISQDEALELLSHLSINADDKLVKLVAKNRYKIDLSLLTTHIPDLSMTKIESKTIVYQPFKKASNLVEKFDGKDNNRLLDVKDVDTFSISSDTEEEFAIDIDLSNIIIDTLTNDIVVSLGKNNGKLS